MEGTYELFDDGWTAGGNCEGWTRNDIESMANAFGVEVEIDDLTSNVYELCDCERKLIGERD